MLSERRVAIIGAGVIGASIADALASRGVRVTLFDMRAPGAGASQASAGVLAPFIEAKPGSPLLALGARSLLMWDDFMAGVRDRAPGHEVEYVRTGTLEVALSDEEHAHLTTAAAWLASEGVTHDWLEGPALVARAPMVTSAARGALHLPDHRIVNVGALVRALVQAARLSGAVCVTPTEIVHVEQVRHGVEVRIGDQRHTFDHVVIAAGSWTRRVRVAGVPVFPVRPIRGQLLHVRWPDGARPAHSIWGTRCYTVPWADGSLLVGATVEDVGFDERATVAGVRELMDAVVGLLPSAADASLEAVRVGLRPATADHLPLLGPLSSHPGVILAAGHYRNGILLAPLTADIVSKLVLNNERDAALDLVSPERFYGYT
ncbi:MAG: glycine oxidase ThiO [Acidimicrobiia bacterium]|nr:glycine oxidase ThiO [Acidimicrobiia bacterium]